MGRWASVRDYIVQECIAKGLTLRMVYGKDSMEIPATELSYRGVKGSPKKFRSKFGGNTYQLINFRWEPETP